MNLLRRLNQSVAFQFCLEQAGNFRQKNGPDSTRVHPQEANGLLCLKRY